MLQDIKDHAGYGDALIAHRTAEGRLVVLEILDASRFLGVVFQAALRGEGGSI